MLFYIWFPFLYPWAYNCIVLVYMTDISNETIHIEDTPKGQGHKTDLKNIANQIYNGELTLKEFRRNNPVLYCRYRRTLQKIEDLALRKKWRTWMTTCEWIYGTSGTRESEYAFKDYNPDTHYIWKDDRGWWDGYEGQETVIINDLRGQISYGKLLTLIDKYPETVRRRGREPTPFLAKHVIITSPLRPEEVYHKIYKEENSLAQLYKRITIRKSAFSESS